MTKHTKQILRSSNWRWTNPFLRLNILNCLGGMQCSTFIEVIMHLWYFSFEHVTSSISNSAVVDNSAVLLTQIWTNAERNYWQVLSHQLCYFLLWERTWKKIDQSNGPSELIVNKRLSNTVIKSKVRSGIEYLAYLHYLSRSDIQRFITKKIGNSSV